MILVALANLLGNLILIPVYGARGAIYGQLIATTLQLVILAVDLRNCYLRSDIEPYETRSPVSLSGLR
jgi:O-antigen/teichoic acid export membrane protein